ncbi:acyl carrier protein [Legionella waltersii]|uniref:Acyl carrier protein n=1 Tax=Legionella waltersii TaxID=66969 RepID=A0A0W0ZZT9_9GAMM|nr:acyl carrier protein [Legionella waltersii]KTD74620.1 acyl carrier protein [Legionella waltersii]SNV08845.1 acyl carrier protein [Legionella waltersii]
MLKNQIKQIFERIGLGHLPEDSKTALDQIGLDSLMLALLIIELEQEFNIKIPVIPLAKERFETLASLENYLIELGVK